MKHLKKPGENLGLLLYAVGILIGVALIGSIIFADIEATFYGFKTITNKSLSSLRCPVFVTRDGQNKIKASVTNTTDKIAKPIMRVNFSNPGPLTPEQSIFELQPGETRKFEWTVSQENIDLGNFIFVNVLVYSFYSVPARQSTCGMVYLDIPIISGTLLLVLLVFFFGLFTVAGYVLWESNTGPLTNRTIDLSRGLKFLAGLVLVGICLSYPGWWLLGGAVFIITILMLGAMMIFLVPRAES
jgi:hypothetical protein